MAEERVSVPNIGDAHDVAVVEVLVQPGTKVEREQPLVVLESDKASMEIPSPTAGVVRKLEVKIGDKVSEGSPLLVIESEGAAAAPAPAKKTNGGEAAAPAPAPAAAPAPREAKPTAAAAPAAPAAKAEERVSVPNIGDAHDVAVVEVLVQPGTRVEREQPLVVLESDKASMEIPSPVAGVVRKLEVKIGDKVSEGSPLLVIESEGGSAAPAPAAREARDATPPPAASRAAKGNGTKPSAGGQLEAPLKEVVEQQEPTERPQTRTIPPAPPMSAAPPKPPSDLPHASPAIRKFARELGVDLRQVTGSGPHGRITKEDVQGYVKRSLGSGGGTGLVIGEAPEIDFSKFGEISVQPLTKIQKVSGKNLHRSWVTIPHVTQFDDADITELENFRKKLKADQPELKITLVTFFMKAMAVAVQGMPRFNSSLDKSGENLVLKRYVHIGVAVDTPNGLVVPVIRDVDKKSLGQLAKELEEVSGRARARKLMPNDFQGASITISSLGGISGTAFTPIINPPEVAVLGVSRAAWKPVYIDEQFVPRLICPLSLSYDHRVIDGADAARFTKRLSELLSDIRMLLV